MGIFSVAERCYREFLNSSPINLYGILNLLFGQFNGIDIRKITSHACTEMSGTIHTGVNRKLGQFFIGRCIMRVSEESMDGISGNRMPKVVSSVNLRSETLSKLFRS